MITPAQALAAHLAAVIANPEIPCALYRDIVDRLNDLAKDLDYLPFAKTNLRYLEHQWPFGEWGQHASQSR